MEKIAIFGGTFDPIHLGHTACLKHLTENMDFAKVHLVPTSINPLKTSLKPAQPQERLAMINLAIAELSEGIEIDLSEMETNEPSYTWNTLERYLADYDGKNIYLCMGIDVFADFDQWKNFEKIVENVNILVLSRPPFQRPFATTDFPKGLQPFISSYDKGYCLLNSDRTIEFVKILTADISSRQVRKSLKVGKNVDRFLALEVEKYIVENQVYPRVQPGQVDFLKLTEDCGTQLSNRAMNAAGYDLRGLEKLYDFTLIASATSTKQAQALASNLKSHIKEEYGLSPFGEEGFEEGRWVILDYGGLIIHIFYDFVRHEYHLEQLWSSGERIDLPKP